MPSHRQKIAAVAVSLVASSLLIPPTASASTYNSHLSNVRSGYSTTRVNHNNDGTIAIELKKCSESTSGVPISSLKLNVELRQDISLSPDRNAGSQKFQNCFNGGAVYNSYGKQAGGKYFAKIFTHDWQSTSAAGFSINY